MKPYPQKPPFSQEELNAFLNEAPVARLGTHNPDGTIHMTSVYFKYDDGCILMGTQDISHKIRNIKQNSQVTVLIDNQEPPWKAVIIYGEASLEYDNVIEKRASIFERYMPAEDALESAKGLAANFVSVVIRITPKQIISYDYSKEGLISH
jgi:nitroimidazol reductase NimA-like FMN-containing flavoprotein (pyridoxamine 5'-phosphate oxidase superfamily)